jgi:hypothetical protein
MRCDCGHEGRAQSPVRLCLCRQDRERPDDDRGDYASRAHVPTTLVMTHEFEPTARKVIVSESRCVARVSKAPLPDAPVKPLP